MKTLDEYFTDWESHAFGFGYGTGEEYTIPALKDFFENLDEGRSYDYTLLEKRFGGLATWLLINRLCRIDLLEYGTSPRFGWVTDKGERLRDFIKTKTSDELLELTARSGDYTWCYPDACNCGPNGYEEGRKCNNPFW